MPDVNLLKDTQQLDTGLKKPLPRPAPELSSPEAIHGAGLGGVFKSLFNRTPKPLPVAPPATGAMALKKNGTGERILSETRKESPVIPLPEEDESTYNVNLLSDDLNSTVDPKRQAILLGVVALGVAVVIGLGYLGLSVYKHNIDQSVSSTEATLRQVKEEAATLAKTQQTVVQTTQKLTAIRSLIDRHTRWTKFFSLLEKYTLPSVTYGPAFTGNLDGSLSLTATAQTYEQVAQQYLIFKQLVASKTFISAFSITSAVATTSKEAGSKVTFVVTMTLLPEDFTMTAEEAQKSMAAALGTTTLP